MKKVIATLAAFVFLLGACQTDPSSKVEQKRQELESRKKELQEKQQLAALEEEMKAVDKDLKAMSKKGDATSSTYQATSGKGQGKITGESVIMRAANSIQSAKIGNFKVGEKVTIIDQAAASTGNEAVVNTPTPLYKDGNNTVTYTLPRGKAVVLESYDSGSANYTVTYQHPDHGKLYAQVPSTSLDYLNGEYWYYVSRSNGARGWVTGKFLEKL